MRVMSCSRDGVRRGQPSLLIGARLLVMPSGRRSGLLDSRPDQSRPPESCDDRVHFVRVGSIPDHPGAQPGHGLLPPHRRPEPHVDRGPVWVEAVAAEALSFSLPQWADVAIDELEWLARHNQLVPGVGRQAKVLG
jgi:hypothetical protein